MSTDTPTFEVQPRQTYVPCEQLNWQRSRSFVVDSVHGSKVKVWDPFGGPRGLGCWRWVALSSLHPTDTTAKGKKRRTGYRLHAGPPADNRQELCGSCMHWLDTDQFETLAWGTGHSTCRQCKAEIDERYGTPGLTKDC